MFFTNIIQTSLQNAHIVAGIYVVYLIGYFNSWLPAIDLILMIIVVEVVILLDRLFPRIKTIANLQVRTLHILSYYFILIVFSFRMIVILSYPRIAHFSS